MHILVVEDQRDFAENIRKYLETESYSVDLAFDGESGLHQALLEDYALVVLDSTFRAWMVSKCVDSSAGRAAACQS